MGSTIFRNFVKWAVFLFFWLAGTGISTAAEYYVSTTGNNSTGNGAVTTPYQTIQHVLDNIAASGDTITLRGGTYNENVRIRNANMTIRSQSGEWAVIQSVINDEDKAIAVTFDTDSDGSLLQRVEVIGAYYYGIKFNTKWDWGDPTDRSGACNITIEDCKIHDAGNACIKVTPGCDDITIRRCEIYNSGRNAPDSAEAIDNVNGDRMLVQQCHIHDITATGLYAKGGASGVIIERCWVENCDGAGILVGFDTSPEFFDTTVNPDYYENIDGTVKNCVVMGTRYAGIGLYAAKNAKVINNTLVDVAREGHSGLYFGLTYQDWDPVAKRPPSLNPVIRNNIVVQSGSMNDTVMEIRYDDELGGMNGLSGMPLMSNNRYYVQNGTASFVDNRPASLFSGNLTQWQAHISGDTASTEGDPQFVNVAGEDYHLSFTSPCVDAGTSSDAPINDYDGVTRPLGQGYDMGAYERVSTAEPNIQANGEGGQITVTPETPVTVTISLSAGDQSGTEAEWWIAAHTPLSSPWNWATSVYGQGWQSGIHMYRQYPLSDLATESVLSSMRLPEGEYTFYFVLDSQINGTPDLTYMDSVRVTSSAGIGHVTYTLGEQIYRVKALEGATPENMTQALNALSPLPTDGRDDNLNISPDGTWLVLDTERFDPDCQGWACLAAVKGDFSTGDVVRVNGVEIHPDGFPAIASGGNLIIYENNDGSHENDLWAVSRSSNAGDWTGPVLLTGSSVYQYNYQPAVNAAGTKVLFDCTDAPYTGATNICEVGTDGTGFRVVLTPSDSPSGLPDTGELHHPDYAPDGSIVFEADWDGENLWRLSSGATMSVKISSNFTNDNSPCVLPDGNIASLWLNRPGGAGDHELKVMKPDGSSYFMLVTGADVADIGLGCGN
jgi:hypothetical protein